MPLTASVFTQFSSLYQKLPSYQHEHESHDQENVLFYVDAMGIKLVTDVVPSTDEKEGDIFALSVADDGFIEMLVIGE